LVRAATSSTQAISLALVVGAPAIPATVIVLSRT
jgi:hypothetical protein